MCLDAKLSKRTKKRIINQAKKRGYVRVFKVCKLGATGTYWSFSQKYKSGLQTAESGGNAWGWYGFLTKQGAERYKCGDEQIKVCYTKPSWILEIGKIGFDCAGSAARFSHLVFPDWKKGNMTIREFRQVCKDSKIKN